MAIKQSKTYLTDQWQSTSSFGSTTYIRSSSRVTLNRYRDSVPLPKYKALIQSNSSATTPLTAYEDTCVITPGLNKLQTRSNKSKPWIDVIDTHFNINEYAPTSFNSSTYNSPLISASMVDAAKAQALSSLYKKIRVRQTPFEGTTMLAELPKTLAAVAGLRKKLGDDIVKLFGATRKRAPADVISSRWLEFNYSILPTISDISTLLTLAQDITERKNVDRIVGYGESITSTTTKYSDITHGYSMLHGVNTTETVLKVQNIIRCGLTSEFKEKIGSVSQYFDGIDDLSSIPVTAWEMIPFSFLVDYFVNIGDIISAGVTATSGISYTSNSVVYTTDVKRYSKSTGPNPVYADFVTFVSSQPKTVRFTRRSVFRTSTLAAIPPLTFSLPGTNARYANMAALLYQLSK